MKRWLALVLVAVLLLTAGCTRSLQGRDRKETEQGSEDATTKPSAQEEEDPVDTPAPAPVPAPQETVYIYQMTENKYNGVVEERCEYNSYGDQDRYILNGNATRRVFEYNAQGQRTKATVYANYSDLQGTYEYIFEDGLWVNTISRDAQGQVVSQAYFEYDSQGQRIAMADYEGDTVITEMTWEYDTDGNVVRESTSSASNYRIREFRYEDGRLVGWYEVQNGTMVYECRYVYENGRIVRDEWLDTSGNVSVTYYYTYNEDVCTLTGTDGRTITFKRRQVTLEQARMLWLRYGATTCFIEQ